jgi:hypothetical protein
MNLREQTLAIAKTKLGVHEVGGDNRGKEVETFLKEAGLGPGNPWCAAFVNWCARQAATTLRVISPLESVKLQGYVPSYVEKFPAVEPKDVLPGDLFAVYHASQKRFAHIGFVLQVNVREGWFETVEGNSNDEGSREGKEVCTNRRRLGSGVRFLRWTKVVLPAQT